jgi:hypothetical protein
MSNNSILLVRGAGIMNEIETSKGIRLFCPTERTRTLLAEHRPITHVSFCTEPTLIRTRAIHLGFDLAESIAARRPAGATPPSRFRRRRASGRAGGYAAAIFSAHQSAGGAQGPRRDSVKAAKRENLITNDTAIAVRGSGHGRETA